MTSGAGSLLQTLLAYAPWFLIFVACVITIVLFGVILPAVWSKNAATRKSALAVLKVLRGVVTASAKAED